MLFFICFGVVLYLFLKAWTNQEILSNFIETYICFRYNNSSSYEEIKMALRIKNDKVISIQPPKNLTKKELDKLENTPINKELIQRATSRKYNIVYK